MHASLSLCVARGASLVAKVEFELLAPLLCPRAGAPRGVVFDEGVGLEIGGTLLLPVGALPLRKDSSMVRSRSASAASGVSRRISTIFTKPISN